MTQIKICGLTTLTDARCAAEAGADFLGFIFYPGSPRYIAPSQARQIADSLRATMSSLCPRLVGVFVDAPVEQVRTIAATAQLDLAQLHGSEPPAVVSALQPFAFKALRPRTLAEARVALNTYSPSWSGQAETSPQLLIDAYHPVQKGGTGEQASLDVARWLAPRCRLMLAGGLTPENVAAAIADLRPWGVDVSSGVESTQGVKHHDRVRAFVAAVRTADGGGSSPSSATSAMPTQF